MHRALSVSRHVASGAERNLVRATRRRLATEAATPPPPTPTPKAKRRVVRNVLLATATVTAGFYVGSTFVAFNNQRYYNFFLETVPLGRTFIAFGERNNWDTLTRKQVVQSARDAVNYIQRVIFGTPHPQDANDTAKEKTQSIKDSKDRLKSIASSLRTDIEKGEKRNIQGSAKAAAIARHQAVQFSEGVEDLVRRAEAALAGKPLPEPTSSHHPSPVSPTEAVPAPEPSSIPPKDPATKNIYDAPLPIGFEPPPGYSRPARPNTSVDIPVKADSEATLLPLVAPAVSEFNSSEPVIAHLASTIDNLASYLSSNPAAAAKAKDVLEAAKVDLTTLATQFEKVRDEERSQLEQKLDEQTREYTTKLLELEMEAQDRLDSQEDGFRKFFDEERVKFVQGYREKLDQELRTQTELINERLKEEVIAQGIELQRRWIREIKIRVEQERGGRLAKLDELAADIKRLERLTVDNSAYLDENLRIHALWSALRALTNTVDAPVRKPFRDQLRVLRHITAARDDPVVASVLDSLEATDVPDVGVEPFADLASWFSTSVAPRVSSVALVPDQGAGVLSHLASHFLSSFQFRRHGLVEGSDVLSVLARAEYFLNEKDLDSAARELNQIKGTAKILLEDWLAAARRRLEVLQALEVVQAQATLASILVI